MSSRYRTTRLRARLVPVELDGFYRIYPVAYADSPLGTGTGSSRFSAPDASYAVLYAASTIGCALWEALLRDGGNALTRRRVERVELTGRVVSRISTSESLELVDLRDAGAIRVGAPTAVVRDRRHEAGQVLSAAVYAGVPEADGFLYPSRFTGEACAALFDRSVSRLVATPAVPLVNQSGVLEALADYELQIVDRFA